MSFPPNPNFDKFIYKSSDLRTKEPSKEQYVQVGINTGNSTGTFETFVNTYLYKIIGNKYQLLGDKKVIIQETDEVVITNKNGKIVKVIKDPINSSEEEETIEVIEDGEPVVKTFTTLYYSYERKNNPENLCRTLIDISTEFYLNRSLPSVFNFSTNTDKLFIDQILKTPFNGDNQWFGVSRTKSTSSPEVLIQIGTDGLILDTFECPLPIEESTDIIQVSLNFEDGIKNLPDPPSPTPPELPPLVPDPGPPTVSATFNSDGGTQINPQTGPSPLYVSQPPNPTKTNFIFNGFSPTLPAVITEDTVFTAIFTPIPPTIDPPTISSSFASSIKADSAVIGGNVINANNGPIESRGSVYRELIGSVATEGQIVPHIADNNIVLEPFQGIRVGSNIYVYDISNNQWNSDNRLDIDNNSGITSDGEGLGVFTSELENLNSGREFIYRAYATNTGNDGQEQISYGEIKSFRSNPLDIKTSVPFDISPISGKGGGLITNTGNLAILSRGLLLAPSSVNDSDITLFRALNISEPNITIIPDTGDLANSLFRLDLGDLTPGTAYKVRAYATNARGTKEGNVKSFNTPPKPLPTVTASTVQINETNITFQVRVDDIGFDDVFEVGILLTPSGTPSITNPPANQLQIIRNVKVTREEEPKSFRISVNGLSHSTQYSFRGYAKNSGGAGQSSVGSVTTLTPSVDPQKPTVTLTDFSYSSGTFFSVSGRVDSIGTGATSIQETGAVINVEGGSDILVQSTTGLIGNTFIVNDAIPGNTSDLVVIRVYARNNLNKTGVSINSRDVVIIEGSGGGSEPEASP